MMFTDIGRNYDLIETDPPPIARLCTFGDTSSDFELLAWAIQLYDRGRAVHDLSTAIDKRSAEEGIAIPIPQRDAYQQEREENNT